MLRRTVSKARRLVHGMHMGRTEAISLVTESYRAVLKREPDPAGLADHTAALLTGRVTPSEFVKCLAASPEAQLGRPALPYPSFGHALHAARMQMVRGLPKADRIVDLGGGAEGDPRGALLMMGYPHRFELLTIVEPPKPDRHELYLGVAPGDPERINTELGTINYLYTSMADLSAIPTGSIDLVHSGESIEHVTWADCQKVLAEARRILKPTGFFCFDTPNRTLTKMQVGSRQFINPDHKYEYTHAEMQVLLQRAGFEIVEAKGISWMPITAKTGRFDAHEVMCNVGLFDDIEACYCLYYRCKPRG